METPDAGIGVKTKRNNQNIVPCVGRWIKEGLPRQKDLKAERSKSKLLNFGLSSAGDTSSLEIRIQLADFLVYSLGQFIVVFNYITAVGLKN